MQLEVPATVPSPNKYIPSSFDILERGAASNGYPRQIAKAPGLTLYYLQDKCFERPRAIVTFCLLLPGVVSSPSKFTNLDVFIQAFSDFVAQSVGHEAELAGIEY